ncbi:hypothetical protein [Cellulosimicrobium sp. JZ28]|uniref:hypothetical protein n=1 Tax=Cellulosimicrobium sp. JZ28 TaxID=1906273 RepID=UPI00188D6E67|nr:hypothetical protein [Cellulosimicrobium sp. JZ28]
MTMQRGMFVRKDDVRGTTPVEARNALAGLLAPLSVGGVLTGMTVVGTDGWAYQVGAGACTFVRGAGDGVVVAANDSAASVPCAPAPATGARWDLVWALHHDVDNGDLDSAASLGVTSGTAAGTPSKPYLAVPAGATVIAECLLDSDDLTTQSAAITQVAPRTGGRGGIVPVQNTTRRAALAAVAAPSARDPLVVYREDAAAFLELEYTTDGTTWRTLAAASESAVITPGAGWDVIGGESPNTGWAARVSRVGDWAFTTGGFARSTGSTGSIGIVPPPFRPVSNTTRPIGTTFTNNGTSGALFLSTGVIQAAAGFGNLSGSGSFLLPIAGCMWPLR